MPDSTNPNSSAAPPKRAAFALPGSVGAWLLWLGLGALWLQLIWMLRYSWSPESSYNYGWLVPVLTGVLLAQRLNGAGSESSKLGPSQKRIALAALFGAVAVFVLSRLLMEVNPFWRMPLWGGALSLSLASLAGIAVALGPRLAKRCIFPLCFALTMVPWPMRIENGIINALTSMVTGVSVEVLRFLGHPAERLGHLIQIGDLSVGVEEACSGIKSLQGLGMLALFVGAFWMLRPRGRIALLICAVFLTSLFNLARSLTLSLLIIGGGQDLFDRWHDTIGYAAFGLGLAVLFVLGRFFQSVPLDPPSAEPRRLTPAFPLRAGAVCVALALVPVAATELWYGDDQAAQPDRVDWIVDVGGAASPGLQTLSLPIHERIAETLGYDYGHHLAILDEDERFLCEMWYYGYTGESPSKSIQAYGHSPTICMTASGAILTGKNEPLLVDLGTLEIPFQHFVFRLPNQQTSHVFWCLWDDLFQGQTSEIEGRTRLAQFHSVFQRQRSFQRKVALLGVPTEDPQAARASATELIRSLFLLQKEGQTFRFL